MHFHLTNTIERKRSLPLLILERTVYFVFYNYTCLDSQTKSGFLFLRTKARRNHHLLPPLRPPLVRRNWVPSLQHQEQEHQAPTVPSLGLVIQGAARQLCMDFSPAMSPVTVCSFTVTWLEILNRLEPSFH